MHFKKNGDPISNWWNSCLNPIGDCEPFPGNMILFVGAGISIDEPTGLPLGKHLTTTLINHLLDQQTVKEVIGVFEKCSKILGRNVPRLEHILDVACNTDSASNGTLTKPENLLNLFKDRRPNRYHQLIAKHLVERKGWVITTNFDNCIERAYFDITGNQLPVHVLSQSNSEKLEVLHGSPDENWGLVKPHGTIEQGVSNLGATLAKLIPSLPIPFRSLFNKIFDCADLIVVAGYSGSDHFDVNAWIRDRINSNHHPRLIWLKHGNQDSEDGTSDDQMEPHKSWISACSGLLVINGETSENLKKLLNQNYQIEYISPTIPKEPLLQVLRNLYTPTNDQRLVNGARLCIAIGLGQLAEEKLRQVNNNKSNKEFTLLPSVYARMGLLSKARELFLSLKRHLNEPVSLQRVKLFRQEGHPFRALQEIFNSIFYTNYYRLSVIDKFELRIEAIEIFLDIIENTYCFAIFRTKPFRRFFEQITRALWPSNSAIDEKIISLALKGKIEIIILRCHMLFSDDYLSYWRLIQEQFSAPQLWMKSGPVIPGYYLVGLITCKEEDRLADFVEMNLSFARILLLAFKRNWPKGGKSRGNTIDWNEDIYVQLLWYYLNTADDVARALNEPHLRVAVSKCIIKADKVLHGFHYWRIQSLYL